MSDTYEGANPLQFDNKGKGMKSQKNKSFGIEHGPSGQNGGKGKMNDAKPKVAGASPDYGSEEHQTEADADTLTRAAEIKQDEGRHGRATAHLEKKAATAKSAHQENRKHLEKRVKKGLKSAFPQGQTFGQEAEKEQAGTKEVEGEY